MILTSNLCPMINFVLEMEKMLKIIEFIEEYCHQNICLASLYSFKNFTYLA